MSSQSELAELLAFILIFLVLLLSSCLPIQCQGRYSDLSRWLHLQNQYIRCTGKPMNGPLHRTLLDHACAPLIPRFSHYKQGLFLLVIELLLANYTSH